MIERRNRLAVLDCSFAVTMGRIDADLPPAPVGHWFTADEREVPESLKGVFWEARSILKHIIHMQGRGGKRR